jgi:TolB-like protein/DNA-binding winged helix-turn-helix (wHTH) protein
VIFRFGNFELKDGELRKAGVMVKLPPQPMSVLQLLLENAGELVTRDQIQRRIWGDQTFVDFDRNLNVCMTQIRAALNDDADSPRFIRTIPKRGYMFLPPVERVNGIESVGALEPPPVRPPVRAEQSIHVQRPNGIQKSNIWLALVFVIVAVTSVAGAWAIWPRPAAPPLPHRIMVAVLPFEGSPTEEPIVDGLADELISSLGSLQTDRLGVIARTSVMHYKSSRPDLKQIARDLNVQYAIEGSVRTDASAGAGRVRVTARLVDVADQRLIWTETYEDDPASLFKVEQDAAARIGAGVARSLFPNLISARKPTHAVSREAYDAYRTGRELQFQGTVAALERSITAFEDAIRLDPQYAEAYAALADSCVSLARSGGPVKPMLARASEAAGKALDLDESSAEAHNALANVRFWGDWNWSDAEQHFTRALVINPSYAAAHHDYAWFLVAMGRSEPALISLRRALALDPLSVRINIDAGWLLLQAHHFQEAIVQAKHARELDPNLEEARECIARAEFFLGRNSKAPPAGSDPYSNAAHFAAEGDKRQALDALERAYSERSLEIPLLNVDPSFTALQAEPRFQRLLVKIGFP